MRAAVEVAPGVLVATSRRDVTTSTIIVAGRDVLLVDPAWDPDELGDLADLIGAAGQRVVAGFATHAHHDHLLWSPRFGSVPRYASAPTALIAAARRRELVAELGTGWPTHLAELVGLVEPFADTVPFDTRIEFVVHDAHAPGHTALWLPEREVLLAGDMLSDVELPLPFDPDDLDTYVTGLDALAPYVARAAVVIPGHGTPTSDPPARLDADRRYLASVLAGRDVDDPRLANSGMVQVHARITAMAR